jgi:hypothetical protein
MAEWMRRRIRDEGLINRWYGTPKRVFADAGVIRNGHAGMCGRTRHELGGCKVGRARAWSLSTGWDRIPKP